MACRRACSVAQTQKVLNARLTNGVSRLRPYRSAQHPSANRQGDAEQFRERDSGCQLQVDRWVTQVLPRSLYLDG